jgi:predicted phosphoribosyltransferase
LYSYDQKKELVSIHAIRHQRELEYKLVQTIDLTTENMESEAKKRLEEIEKLRTKKSTSNKNRNRLS